MNRSDLLSVADLGREGIVEVLRLADSFAEVSERPVPKVPALRGRTVATVFFESSTRTRLSFEAAAKRLSADTMTFTAASSSVAKGESVRDTVETLDAMGVDAMVVRHSSAGTPAQVARWVRASVVNAGDGQHEHPTQALLDCFTLREALARRDGRPPGDDLAGVRIAIVGDVRHSRVARSGVLAYRALGATVVLVAPPTLLPPDTSSWGVTTSGDLDEVLPGVDVVYLLRLQAERIRECLLPSLHEYSARYALTAERERRLAPEVLVMHPGPMVRGVEIDSAVASSARSLVTRQVRNGVAVRMAVLFRLLAGAAADPVLVPSGRAGGEP
ncbi:MAG: aspartate carbamoyltransferase catalytic subunit [Actinomycetota bacterium]|nr:aspartate carbamoyltransferase catalytic subunit [Actinomycetota bacterium]